MTIVTFLCKVIIPDWAVYCDRPTQLYLKGRGRVEGEGEDEGRGNKIEEHFPEASACGAFDRRIRPEEFSSAGDFGLGRNLQNLESPKSRINPNLVQFWQCVRIKFVKNHAKNAKNEPQTADETTLSLPFYTVLRISIYNLHQSLCSRRYSLGT